MTSVENESKPAGPGFRFNFNFGCAIGVILFGVAIWVLTPYQVEKAVPLFGEPASGLDAHLFPRLIAAIFVTLGILYFIKAFVLKEDNELLKLNREAIINTVVSFVSLGVFAFAMVPIGFVISGALVMFFLSTFYGNRTWWLGILISTAIPFGIYNLFTKVLLVYLPEFPYADLGWL